MIAANFRRTHSPSRLAWSEGWRPPGAQSTFTDEPGELSQWLWSWWQHHKHCHGYYYYCCYWLMRRLKAGVRVQDATTSLIIQQPPTPLVWPLQAAHCQFVKWHLSAFKSGVLWMRCYLSAECGTPGRSGREDGAFSSAAEAEAILSETVGEWCCTSACRVGGSMEAAVERCSWSRNRHFIG